MLRSEAGADGGRLPLFTIGHSNHPIGHFLALLRQQRVEIIADVRSRPYSRFVPHFGKERLARLLETEGLGYLYLGRGLGGQPPKDERQASPITYQMRVAQAEFDRGVDRLLEAVRANRVALMCRERDPLDCHRFHLVCRYLRPLHLDVRHILPSGEVELQQLTERRLLERAEKRQLDLFDGADRAALERTYDSWWQPKA